MASAVIQVCTQCLRRSNHVMSLSRLAATPIRFHSKDSSATANQNSTPRKGNTPIGKFDEAWEGERQKATPAEETNAYAPFPDDKNPETGEIGGPRGPEPTRYGDWERKGRCVDF